MNDERGVRTTAHSIEASRVVDAPATEIFRFLRAPANHAAVLDTSGNDLQRCRPGGADHGRRRRVRDEHRDENHVVAYEPDRLIG